MSASILCPFRTATDQSPSYTTRQPFRRPHQQPPPTQPSSQPSFHPTTQSPWKPYQQPTPQPTFQSSHSSTSQPSCRPPHQPSTHPPFQPSHRPTRQSIQHPSQSQPLTRSGSPLPTCDPFPRPSKTYRIGSDAPFVIIPCTQPSAIPSLRPPSLTLAMLHHKLTPSDP